MLMVHNLQPEPFKQNLASLIFIDKNESLIAITNFNEIKLFRLDDNG